MSVDDIVPRQHGEGERDFVLRAVFVAPDLETAQRIGTEVVSPLLFGRLVEWEVVETVELLRVDEQASRILADYDADNAEEGG